MSDLIDREDVIKAIEENFWEPYFVHDAIEVIRELPSAQPERKSGKWMLMRASDDGHGTVKYQYLCSKCGYPAYEFDQPYCHHCGSYMKE